MKFKNKNDGQEDYRELLVSDKDGRALLVETIGKGVYFAADGALLTKAKALKLAWAIIDELNPSIL